MTTTFGGTELKNASKGNIRYPVKTTTTGLMSGKDYVQYAPAGMHGTEVTVSCLGERADITALLSLVGSKQTLITDDQTFTNMIIQGEIEERETDAPGWFEYIVHFVRHTAA
jgi:hypothetical protein